MHKEREVLEDASFAYGFLLQGTDPALDGRKIFKVFKTSCGKNPVWRLAQWWTPFDLVDSSLNEYSDGSYSISSQSRFIKANPGAKELRLNLDSNIEYENKIPGGIRTAPSQGWSHALIEQDFSHPSVFSSLKKLIASIGFTIDEVKTFHLDQQRKDLHAAQLLWYITIREDNGGNIESGLGGNYIWLGLPLYDSRFPYEGESLFFDIGNSGSTKKLIYSTDSRLYLPTNIVFGQTYHFSLDILPIMRKAVSAAIEKGIFDKQSHLIVNYMNFGWELPGNHQVRSIIHDISIKEVL